MAAAALGPGPSLDKVRTGLAGNICRCTGYEGIYRAIRKAEARSKKQEARSKEQEARRQKTGDRRQKKAAPGLAPEQSALNASPGRRFEGRIPSPESRIPKASTRRRA
jgi:xanthine dehydrogenase iron-sulfur cluster and FAD-binding subunit A